jgi:flagellar basal body-associated protein FliL
MKKTGYYDMRKKDMYIIYERSYRRRRKRRGYAIKIILVVLLALGIGGTAFFLIKNQYDTFTRSRQQSGSGVNISDQLPMSVTDQKKIQIMSAADSQNIYIEYQGLTDVAVNSLPQATCLKYYEYIIGK